MDSACLTAATNRIGTAVATIDKILPYLICLMAQNFGLYFALDASATTMMTRPRESTKVLYELVHFILQNMSTQKAEKSST